ncbi:MAG: FAD-dependent oxidoreductase [Pseudomonadota bacterium]
MTRSKFLILLLLASGIGLFFGLGLQHQLTLGHLQASRADLLALYAASPVAVLAGFFAAYVAVTALSLPGAAIMTLAAGALFGVGVGTVLVSFASSLGATLAFLAARHVMADWVEKRFGDRLKPIHQGIAKSGARFLFTLRLVPLFPFMLINLVMGLTRMPTLRFYWVSQLGMLPGTLLYVNAGTQLATIDTLSKALNIEVIASIALLALFPFMGQWLMTRWDNYQLYKVWPKPKRFDRNLIAIGAGAGGLVSTYIGAATKARVTLIEAHEMGGDCLNYGCVPSKALIRTAALLRDTRHAQTLGLAAVHAEIDFSSVMERVQRVIADVAPHDSVERYTSLGVEVLKGHARITSPWSVEINGQTLTTRNIVIAAGAAPTIPDLPGLDQVVHVTSDSLWSLRGNPREVVVLGGGPIACELAQAMAELGIKVTLVGRNQRLLPKEDEAVGAAVLKALKDSGVRVLTGAQAMTAERDGGVQRLWVQHHGETEALSFDVLLLAVGRSARTTGYGLEALGIGTTRQGTIEVNEYLQTRYPNIYACGDVIGPYQFTHVAAHQAWYAAVNALFGALKRFKADYRVIPAVTFTHPEVARVGLNQQEAVQQGIAYEVSRFELEELDRAITADEREGFVEVLTVPGKDRILGVTIVAAHAGEMLAEFTLAMKHGLGLKKILGTIHPYPTWSEAAKYVAGVWQKAHAPEAALRWAERYHRWQRGE